MTNIHSSVGKYGVNNQSDISTIQKLLNRNRHLLIPLPKLREDGVLDEETLKAIATFQKRVVLYPNPDCRVDPGGKTLRKLNENARLNPESSLAKLQFPLRNIPPESYKENPRKFTAPRSGGRLHAGCDLYQPPGTEILAMADGIVIKDPYNFYDGTLALEVDHGTFSARYGEIKKAASGIRKGTHVKQGQVIAYVGYLPSLNMSMLHLEMYSGTQQGCLTTGTSPYKRRSDLLDPTEFLDYAKGVQTDMTLFEALVATCKETDLGQVFASLNVTDVPEENYPALKIATLAQWILESGRGTSELAQQHFNFGGLKWRDEMAEFATKIRYVACDGPDYYCKFPSIKDFIRGYWRFIQRFPYKGWQNSSGSPQDYITFLKDKGYAGDPNYVTKVCALFAEATELLGGSTSTETRGTWMLETDAAIYWMLGGKYIEKLEKQDAGDNFKVIITDLKDWFTGSPYPAPGTMQIAKGDVPEPDKLETITPPPPIRFDSAHTNNYSKGRTASINAIVLHNTAGSFAGACSWFKNPNAGVSAHYVISRSGEIVQMVKDEDTAYHARGGNSCSIGIEHEADANHRGLTAEMEKASVALIKMLMAKYNLPADRVLPHRTDWGGFPGNSTTCPNLLWSSKTSLDNWRERVLA